MHTALKTIRQTSLITVAVTIGLFGILGRSANANSVKLDAKEYNLSGNVAFLEGEYSKAAHSYQTAAKNYRKNQDFEGYLGATTNQSLALQKLGQYQQAADVLSGINPESYTTDPELLAKYSKNLGVALATIGRYSLASEHLSKSYKTTADPILKSAVALDLGNINVSENPEAALNYYQLATLASNSSDTAVSALIAKIEALQTLGRTAEAVAAVEIAKNKLRGKDPDIKLNLAAKQIWLARKTDRVVIQQTDINRLKKIAKTGTPQQKSYAYGYLGEIANQHQQYARASSLNQKAIALVTQNVDEPEIAFKWQHAQGKIEASSGNTKQAIEFYSSAIENIARVRGDLVGYNKDLQYSYKENLEPIYRELVGLLVQNPTQNNLAVARNTIESLQIVELENYFRQACLTGKVESIDNIDPLAATIYPIVLEDKLATIVAIGNKPLQYHETAVGKTEVEATISSFLANSNISASNKRRFKFGADIHGWLIEPHLKEFEQQKIETLVFILDGKMRNLPIAAINNSQNRYLIKDYAVAITPGLQLLDDEKQNESLQAVVGGLSESNEGFTALPGVSVEVEELAQNVESTVLLNKNFTNQALKTALAQEDNAGILHLATHGQFSSDPEETFIKTYNDRITVNEMDELLRVRQETPKLKPVDLLMLSACNTLTGDDRAALGLAGVAIKSGARSTIGTLWQVNDRATSTLVNAMYQNLEAGMTKGESLRQAQLKLIESKDTAHPSYWSPFVLVGQWQ